MISALCFIPKGTFAEVPFEKALKNEDLEAARTELQLTGLDKIPKKVRPPADPNDPFNMHTYDDEDHTGLQFFQEDLTGKGCNSKITHAFDSESENDDEDFRIKNTDFTILACTSEADQSLCELYVYDEAANSLYVHHDFLLEAPSLVCEWLTKPPKSDQSMSGNFVAFGTMSPVIEIWDLDMLEPMEASVRLDMHTDSVMALARHPSRVQGLASGSSDNSVILWDLEALTGQVVRKLTDKCQILQWDPENEDLLYTADYSRILGAHDLRTSNIGASLNLDADPEAMVWLDAHTLALSLEDGQLLFVDTRQLSTPLNAFQAHKSACSGLGFSNHHLVTGSIEGQAKVWDVSNLSAPKEKRAKDLKVGPLYCCDFARDSDELACLGGDQLVLLYIEEKEDKESETHLG